MRREPIGFGRQRPHNRARPPPPPADTNDTPHTPTRLHVLMWQRSHRTYLSFLSRLCIGFFG